MRNTGATGTVSVQVTPAGTAVAPRPGPTASRRELWVLAAACTVGFARTADPRLWMMGLEIPDRVFGAGWQTYRVFSTASMLLMLACMLFGGLAGDYFGRRRVLLLGASLSVVAGVLAAVAPGVQWFAATRLVEVGAGAVAYPLTLAVVRLTFHGRQRPLALLVYTAITGVGFLVALLAIVIEQHVGWRTTLVLPVATGAAGAFLCWRYVPESRAHQRVLRRAATATAWALTLLPLTLCFVGVRLTGTWTNAVTLIALAVAAGGGVALLLLWRGGLRARLTQGITRRRRHLLSVMLLTQGALCFALTGYALQVYGFLSVVEGYGDVVAGVALLPLLAAFLTVRWAAGLALRSNVRRVIGGGLAMMGLAVGLTALLRPGTPYWLLVPPMALFGFGYLVAQTAWTTAYMSAMPDPVVGASAGIAKATASAGATLSGALLGTVLLNAGQADLNRLLDAQGLTAAQRAAATATLNAALQAESIAGHDFTAIQDAALMTTYHQAYATGVAAALLAAAAVCLLLALLAWTVLEEGRANPVGAEASPEDAALADLI